MGDLSRLPQNYDKFTGSGAKRFLSFLPDRYLSNPKLPERGEIILVKNRNAYKSSLGLPKLKNYILKYMHAMCTKLSQVRPPKCIS